MKHVPQRLSLRLSQIFYGRKQEISKDLRECTDLLDQLHENFTKENLVHLSDSFARVITKYPTINKIQESYINTKLSKYCLELDPSIRRKARVKPINEKHRFVKFLTNQTLCLSNIIQMMRNRDQNEQNNVQSVGNVQQEESNKTQSIHNKKQMKDNTRQRIENEKIIRSLKEQIKTYDAQIQEGKRLIGDMVNILLELYLSIDEGEYEALFHHTIPMEQIRYLANAYA
ncbi:hypothetical protein CAAN1_17S01354 [[Candida] anglica]|uniref:Uncharacterized protein n=1 Tax=[Candida] anglica TaxID=148631 RepID=A0ABP0EBY4_9ASCO